MRENRRIHPAIWLSAIVLALIAAAVAIYLPATRSRIVTTVPRAGDESVPITQPIRVTFSRSMNQSSVENHLRIEPEISGDVAWDGREMTLFPHGGLVPGTAYTVTVGAEALDARGQPLGQEGVWRFSTRPPQLLYLGRTEPDQDARQLFAVAFDPIAPQGIVRRQLSDSQWGVWDYAVHPQGQEIVYSTLRPDGGSDLWTMNREGDQQRQLLACPKAACLAPAWSPDGRWLAYERRDIWADAPNLDPRAGRIWLLDIEKGKERPLFDYDIPLHTPVWAPDGQRLAYVSPSLPGVEVYHLETEELLQYANQWGAAPIWAPDGTKVVMPELLFVAEEMAVRLLVIELEDGSLLDISGDEETDELYVHDTSPAWSPGGGWIAFGRRFLDDARWTPGRQIWLVRPDGSEAYPLLEEPVADHFALTWRPDGAMLAYIRSDLSEGPQPIPDVSVWVYDLVLRESRLVANEGVLPRWMP
jgi:hypothetical protein